MEIKMINILSIFSKQIHYPNNLADGFKPGVIYHGVSKNFMTGIASFTNPLLAMTLERSHQVIEENRFRYLDCLEKQTVRVSELDDFILVSESAKSYWIFSLGEGELTGSIGNIPKSLITFKEFSQSIENNIKKIKKSTRKGSLTGEYMVLPTKDKIFCFHQ